MKDFIIAIGVICAGMIAILGCLSGSIFLSNYWECSSYKEAQTKMIAGSCYVKTEKGKWILFSSYVKQLNVKEE